MKLKKTDIKPLREHLQIIQDDKCAICKCDFSAGYWHRQKGKAVHKHTSCLDHSHTTGAIRGVLCSGCNALEGKVINCISRWHTEVSADDATEVARILYALAHYTVHHSVDRNLGKIHPTFRSEEEKRSLRNKRARTKRKQTK